MRFELSAELKTAVEEAVRDVVREYETEMGPTVWMCLGVGRCVAGPLWNHVEASDGVIALVEVGLS